jgi:gas vesicle protein
MNEHKHCGAGSILFSFLLGGLVGSALTFLYAPMSGSEARQSISGLKDSLKEKADDIREETIEKAESVVQKGKDFIEDNKSIITSAIEAGKEAYQKEKDNLTKDS